MLTTSNITAEQQACFDHDGYLVVPQLVTGTLLGEVQAGYDDAVAGRLDVPEWADRWSAGSLMQLPSPCTHIPQLQERRHHAPILAVARQLMGVGIDFWYDQLIYKPAGNPFETPWHQDSGYWQLSDLPALTCWLAVHDVDADMGCMQFVPGSHRQGIVAHRSVADINPINNAKQVVDLPAEAVSVPLRAGDVTFHHACTLHYTAGNSGTRDRCGLVHHLADHAFLRAHDRL